MKSITDKVLEAIAKDLGPFLEEQMSIMLDLSKHVEGTGESVCVDRGRS